MKIDRKNQNCMILLPDVSQENLNGTGSHVSPPSIVTPSRSTPEILNTSNSRLTHGSFQHHRGLPLLDVQYVPHGLGLRWRYLVGRFFAEGNAKVCRSHYLFFLGQRRPPSSYWRLRSRQDNCFQNCSASSILWAQRLKRARDTKTFEFVAVFDSAIVITATGEIAG